MKFTFKLHTKDNFGKRILLLDRDGVVIEDTGYPIEINNLEIKKNTIEKLIDFKEQNSLNNCGFVTNQSGVSREYFSEKKFWETHEYIIKRCFDLGLEIDFTCVNFFMNNNYFRKPNNGMLETAINYTGAIREQSFMVGDKETDMAAAKKSSLNYEDISYFI